MKYIAMLGMVVALACSESPKVEPLTYPEIFSGKTKTTWRIRSAAYTRPGKASIPLYFGDCNMDDLYVFYNNAEKTIKVLSGIPCNKETDPPGLIADLEENWAFVNANSTIYMPLPILTGDPFPSIPGTVTAVDNSKMVVEYFLDDGSSYLVNFQLVSHD